MTFVKFFQQIASSAWRLSAKYRIPGMLVFAVAAIATLRAFDHQRPADRMREASEIRVHAQVTQFRGQLHWSKQFDHALAKHDPAHGTPYPTLHQPTAPPGWDVVQRRDVQRHHLIWGIEIPTAGVCDVRPTRVRFERARFLMPVAGTSENLPPRIHLDLIRDAESSGMKAVQMGPDMRRYKFRKKKIIGVEKRYELALDIV